MKGNYINIGNREVNRTQFALGFLGNAAGLIYAYAQGKGFWGYVGFYILGGMVGSGLGYLLTKPIADEQKKG